MAKHAETLIKGNGLEGRIVVVNSVGACVLVLVERFRSIKA